MAYDREEVQWAWLLVVFLYRFFLVKGTTPAKKKPICAEMTINTQADFELYLFSEEEDDGENRVLAVSRMSLYIAVYFTTFESVIVSRNTRRPCYISKRAYSCRNREF